MTKKICHLLGPAMIDPTTFASGSFPLCGEKDPEAVCAQIKFCTCDDCKAVYYRRTPGQFTDRDLIETHFFAGGVLSFGIQECEALCGKRFDERDIRSGLIMPLSYSWDKVTCQECIDKRMRSNKPGKRPKVRPVPGMPGWFTDGTINSYRWGYDDNGEPVYGEPEPEPEPKQEPKPTSRFAELLLDDEEKKDGDAK